MQDGHIQSAWAVKQLPASCATTVKSNRFDVWRVGCATRENGHCSELTRLRDRLFKLLIKFAKASVVNKEPGPENQSALGCLGAQSASRSDGSRVSIVLGTVACAFQACASHSCQVDQRATMTEIHRRSIGEVVQSNTFTL